MSISLDNIKRIPYTGSPEEKEFLDMIGYDADEVKVADLPAGDIELTNYNETFEQTMNELSEEFDTTGDESLMRMQKIFEDFNKKTQGFLDREETFGNETKMGELPAEPETGDISTLFEEKLLTKRTSFLSRQLKKFKDWRARNKSNPEIKDELDDMEFEFGKTEDEFNAFNDATDAEVNEMMGESKQIEMTPRGNPNEITPEEADLFDDLNIWGGETKSGGNLEAFGEGKLPPEISQSGFSAEELGVEMSGDDFIISEGGEVLDLTGVEGEEMLGRIASIVSANAETTGAVARGLSVAGDVLGVVGIGLAVGSTIYQIYDGISKENKYEEAGDKYVAMGGDITKINKALRESYNKNAKQMNAYTQLYHKWVFQKKDPTQEDKGRQMPLFNYSSNFDSITTDERMDKISTYMISSVIQKQQRDLSKMVPAMRIGLQALYNTQNEALKKNIIEGLDRVSQGKENTQWDWLKDMIGTDPDSTDDLMSVDVKAQVEGGIKLKAIYDAYREMDLRNKFMTKAYKLTLDTKEAQDERFQLNTIDHRMLGHFEDQTNQDPAFQSALQARTDEINKNFKWRVDREYAKHFQDINIKWKKSEDMVAGLPEPMKSKIIKSYEEKRKAEWNVWNRKKQKAYGTNISKEQVAQNNYPPKYQFMINLQKQKPYWIEYYKKNKQKYYRDDMNEILSNRKKWLEGTTKRNLLPKDEDKVPPPYTGDDDSDDYNPFINPKKDIKRIPLKPVVPIVPVIPKPDEPIKPKPPPLPPAPKRPTPRRRLLGATDFDFEPEKDNEFDDDIGFDVNLAIHMLHLCEHSYKAFEDNNYFPTSEVFDYDEATTMGSENFAVSEQGRMYYSSTDNVISIAYRGTDFGRTYTRPDLFVADLINDISVKKVNYEGLILHSGFLDFFLKTQEEVMNFINSHINNDTLIYTTGHSYGAIPSMILAFILNKHYGERRAINYTFGSPRGMDRTSARIVATQLTAFRIADIQDPITLLPPSGSGYFHAGRTIYLNGDVMKEIIDMDEADRLYNIAGGTIAKTGGLVGTIIGIQKMLHGISTPEQVSLASRLGSFFNNFVNPAQAIRNIYSNLKDLSLYAMYFSGQISNPSVRSNRYALRQSPERMGRMNIMKNMRNKHSQVIIDRFIAQYPKTEKYLNKEIMSDMTFGGMDSWSELMKTEGKGKWTKRLVDVIDGTNSAPRGAIKGFFNQMEMMMFPDKINEYQDYMRDMGLGTLLNLFPNKVALQSAVLTAGGIVSLMTMVGAVYKTYSFVELNKHALEKYDELLDHHTHKEILHGSNVRTEKEMLQDADAVKDGENNFYSTTQDEHNGNPIFTQTDNDHLKFIPKYHKDTGMTMMPIPHDLRGAILGFVVLSDEQYESPNMIKGVVVY